MSQSSFNENELRNWIKGTVHRFPNLGLADEDPEEEYVAQDAVSDSELIDTLNISSISALPKNLIFVDGVMRYRVVGTIDVQNIQVPLVLAHTIAGAMKLENKELYPLKKKELLVVIFPFDVTSKLIGQSILPSGVLTIESGRVKFGNFLTNSDREIIFSDTTITLGEYKDQSGQLTGRPLINGYDLIASSKIISTAKNRIKEILRTLELTLIIDIARNITDSDLIIVDGPIAPLFKYAGLVDPSLRGIVRGLNDRKNATDAYYILKGIIGAVKKVIKIPSSLTTSFIGLNNSAYIYLWTKLIEDQIEGREENYISTHILSSFFRLRAELISENYPVFSPTSGLIRIDVPLPAIMDKDEWLNWIPANHEEVNDQGKVKIKQLLQNNVNSRSTLTELSKIVYSLRYPLPSSSPYRNLVELYPIKEVEDWLKSCLLSKYDIATLGLF
ncbi:hypothetical protein [Metallosphaera sedula]|uniref:hypothetical protein n=1 Tax=Metallosphaera sedula TaxID=43687 RepID=UPI0020BD70F6|nr:hypothetical protein [Metallosphaera sedula]BBL48359.1 hypothetical protein MJ1HA_2481 [Metallosphaera sedula]